jgi:hypothetical protein
VESQETLYLPRGGALPVSSPSPTRRRGTPVLAPILALCAVGWLGVGVFLTVVDTHSWDVIVPLTLAGSGFYLFLARWAYRDWRDKSNLMPRTLDAVRAT